MITAFIVVTVLLVLGIGYLLWTRTSTAQLTAAPGVQPGTDTAPVAGATYAAANAPQVASTPPKQSLVSGGWNAVNPTNALGNAVGSTKAATTAGVTAIVNAAKNPVSLLNPVTGIKVALASPTAAVKSLFKL